MRIDEQDMDVDRCWDNNLDDDSTWCGQSLHTSDRAPYNLRIKSERTDFEHLANSQQYLATRSKTQERVSFRPTWKAGPCSETKNGINTPISLSAAGKSCLKLLKWEYCHSGKFAIQIFPIINDCQRIFLAWGLELNINVYCGCQKHSPFHFFQLFSKANSLTLGQVWSQWCYWKFSNVSSSKKIWGYSRIFPNPSMEKS